MTQREHPDVRNVTTPKTAAAVEPAEDPRVATIAEVLRDQFPHATMRDHWFGARRVLAALEAGR